MDLAPKEAQEIRDMIQARADRDGITFNEAVKRIADEIKEIEALAERKGISFDEATDEIIRLQKDPVKTDDYRDGAERPDGYEFCLY